MKEKDLENKVRQLFDLAGEITALRGKNVPFEGRTSIVLSGTVDNGDGTNRETTCVLGEEATVYRQFFKLDEIFNKDKIAYKSARMAHDLMKIENEEERMEKISKDLNIPMDELKDKWELFELKMKQKKGKND